MKTKASFQTSENLIWIKTSIQVLKQNVQRHADNLDFKRGKSDLSIFVSNKNNNLLNVAIFF